MKPTGGFLIGLTDPESPRFKNKKYRGIDRVPSYRFDNQEPIEEETEAMESYIFGDIRNELGLIKSYDAALALLAQLAKSPRKFEMIRCRIVPGSRVEKMKTIIDRSDKFIGYDVAGLGGDFSDDARVASDFAKLNGYGLFDSANDAVDYLNKYRLLRLPDYDCPFEIVEVHLMQHKRATH